MCRTTEEETDEEEGNAGSYSLPLEFKYEGEITLSHPVPSVLPTCLFVFLTEKMNLIFIFFNLFLNIRKLSSKRVKIIS